MRDVIGHVSCFKAEIGFSVLLCSIEVSTSGFRVAEQIILLSNSLLFTGIRNENS